MDTTLKEVYLRFTHISDAVFIIISMSLTFHVFRSLMSAIKQSSG